jgi:hypothetical protein
MFLKATAPCDGLPTTLIACEIYAANLKNDGRLEVTQQMAPVSPNDRPPAAATSLAR